MSPPSDPNDLCREPLHIDVYRDAVVLLGPDNVHLAMTLEAAEASLLRLAAAIEAAREARANPQDTSDDDF